VNFFSSRIDQDPQMNNICRPSKILAKPTCNIETKQTTQHLLLTQTPLHNTHNKKPKNLNAKTTIA
jgi:hypothetical protein